MKDYEIYINFPEVPFHQQRGVMFIDGSVQMEDNDIWTSEKAYQMYSLFKNLIEPLK